MKKFNILLATSAFALLATGCVKPTQETQQPTYTEPAAAPVSQGVIYEEAQPIVYEPSAGTTIYETVQPDGTVPPDGTVITTPVGTSGQATGGVTYPDPYATGGSGAGTVYNDPYAGQSTINDYPTSSSTSSSVQGGGIHLQVAALKDYYTAEDYKNRLSLAPGQSAYVKRGAMNKVIVTGIASLAEANRLKESRFPGAFIAQGGTSGGGYTPSVQPNYDTSGGVYNVNNPYGSSSSSAVTTGSGTGVQVGAFGSMGKAQSVANSQAGKYPAIVKKIGRYYKVILTGFSSRSAAKAHAGRVGGFVVNY